MSRIGKKPILLVEGVSLSVKGSILEVTGKHGVLSMRIHSRILISVENNYVSVSLQEGCSDGSIHGLYRTLVHNMVTGVSQLWKKELKIHGIGYKFEKSSDFLLVYAGYSSPRKVVFPDVVKFIVGDRGEFLSLSSCNLEVLGDVADKVRRIRLCEPYNGRGIFYKDEVVFRKSGKTAGKK